MNKFIPLLLLAFLPISSVFASDNVGGGYYETYTNDCSASNMRHELDNATLRGRAVTTVVKCNDAAPQLPEYRVSRRVPSTSRYGCFDCNQPIETVVSRKYFVQETREVYKPVVKYVRAGTYTTTREVCADRFGCR